MYIADSFNMKPKLKFYVGKHPTMNGWYITDSMINISTRMFLAKDGQLYTYLTPATPATTASFYWDTSDDAKSFIQQLGYEVIT